MTYLLISNLLILFVLLYTLRKFFVYKYRRKTFQRLMDHTNIGYYKYRCADGVILAMNKGFISILELRNKTAKDVIGHSLSEFLIYVDGEESIRARLQATRELHNYEYHFKTLEDKDKYVLHNSYIEKDSLTGEDVIEALVQDITEEKSAYESMRQSQERYENLFKNSKDMVIICRMDDFAIEEINPIIEVVTKFSENELVGMPLEKLICARDKRKLKEIRKDLLFRSAAHLETEILCKDGSRRQVLVTLSVVKIKNDEIVLAIIKDVSFLAQEMEGQRERKRELETFWETAMEREERVRDLRRETEELKKELNKLKEKYESGNKN
ncbi:MAG: PAS domain-containing protein [Candidatus Omnitrophica bacterium]|nr:PAS domain-containing protein [Candidatus Omnitrophota bacterium]